MNFEQRELVLLLQLLALQDGSNLDLMGLREKIQVHLETKGNPKLGYHEVGELMDRSNPFRHGH